MNPSTLPQPPVRPRREPLPAHGADMVDGNGNGHHPDEIPTAQSLAKPRTGVLIAIGVGAIALIGCAFAIGYLPKVHNNAELRAEAEARIDTLVPVSLALPQQAQAASQLDLPGNIQPLQETAIYARTTGYLKRWLVDIGAHVEAGQLLAEIDSPEVDQELQQAKATLQSDQANVSKMQLDLTFVETTLKRYETLIPTNGVTPQELDQNRANAAKARTALAQAQATVASDEANVRKLQDMVSFERVLAPFTGTITVRNYDIGALITANGVSGVQPMFRLAQTDMLRVWVNVPQSYATVIKPGLEAKLGVREYPHKTFVGKVANIAGALDTNTRTMMTEVRVPNADGQLIAGMFCQVKFDVTSPAPPLIIPVSALITNAQNTQVAVVGADDVAHFKQVELGQDFGTSVEVVDGLSPTDRIVTNPGERLVEGGRVRIVSSQAQPTPPTQTPPPPAPQQKSDEASHSV